MSVVGIDFGNLNSVVAVARKRGIDVLANEASRRETPTMVAFRDDQRYLGEKASTQQMSNLQGTITDFKNLLGRKYSQPEVQALLPTLPFRVKQMEGDNIGIEVEYQNQTQIFSVEQITAMMLINERKIVEADSAGKIKVQEVVISVPTYWTDAQRRALKDAAEIAGLNCHQLLNEPTALAIPYGMYKKDLPEDSDPLLVLFVNFGHASCSAAVVAFSKTSLRVISTVYDDIGGRDFDEQLYLHFAKEALEKNKVDISKNNRAQLRLRQACEKLKRVLTGINEAPIYVENLANDVDFRSMIKREEFETLIEPVLIRAERLAQKAVADANLTKPLNFVEVVGGSSYVPGFQHRLAKATGLELSHTQNKSESVARGCAIQCAIISPQFHINRNVVVKDYNPYSISVTWTELATGQKQSAVLFKKGEALPAAKRITFKKSAYEISADYSDASELPAGTLTHIAKFVIPKFEPTIQDLESLTVEVKFKLDNSGLFCLDYARAVESFYEIEAPAPTETKPAEGATPAAPAAESKPEGEQPAAEAAAPAAEAPKDADGDTVMAEPKKKKKSKTTNLVVSATFASGLSRDTIRSLASKELAMQAADNLAIATAEAKNALESYAYDSQSKLQFESSEWSPYASETERTEFLAAVDDVISWLYADGDQATKEAYESRLNQLRVLGDPLDTRKNEDETRPAAVEALTQALANFAAFVSSSEEKYAHIEQEDRQKVDNKVKEIQDWLVKMKEKQEALAKHETPVLLSASLKEKSNELTNFCTPIVNKPKPKPKVEEKPKEEPKPAEPTPAAADQPQAAPADQPQASSEASADKPAEPAAPADKPEMYMDVD